MRKQDKFCLAIILGEIFAATCAIIFINHKSECYPSKVLHRQQDIDKEKQKRRGLFIGDCAETETKAKNRTSIPDVVQGRNLQFNQIQVEKRSRPDWMDDEIATKPMLCTAPKNQFGVDVHVHNYLDCPADKYLRPGRKYHQLPFVKYNYRNK